MIISCVDGLPRLTLVLPSAKCGVCSTVLHPEIQAFWDIFVAFFIVFSVVEVTFRLGFDAQAEGR